MFAFQSPSGSVSADLVVRGLSASLGAVPVLEQVHLSVAAGEFVALVGPSGCGKSTLLNIIAGLLDPDQGTIELAGNTEPKRLGKFAYMPQRDALLPWRTVLENATLAAEVRGTGVAATRRRALDLLPAFGLDGFAGHFPATLSGGMRQRAAFLRTVLADKPILLLDEPFGALDALTRSVMQEWLLELWSALGRSVLMVTHDIEEALLLADRVAIMTARPGRIKRVEAVAVSRPRGQETVADPAFVAQKVRLLAELRSEVGGFNSKPAHAVRPTS